MGDLVWVLSEVQPGSPLTVAGFWEVKQQVENLCLQLSFFPVRYTEFILHKRKFVSQPVTKYVPKSKQGQYFQKHINKLGKQEVSRYIVCLSCDIFSSCSDVNTEYQVNKI